jgi:hypothetical protein
MLLSPIYRGFDVTEILRAAVSADNGKPAKGLVASGVLVGMLLAALSLWTAIPLGWI